ncbi:MAG: CoA transferase, partial [Chloroflexota bacterium]|nr:CoA transferase [Chloroflexota bacterium]
MNLKLLKVLFLVFAKLTEGADAIDNGQVLNLGVMPTVPYEALAGYLVIDLSDRLAGSFCAKTLGLYGSEVIKIEPPEGDPLRKLDHTEDETDESDSPLFLHLNAGKKSLTLNLETREGKEILSNLLEKADILVETFIPG